MAVVKELKASWDKILTNISSYMPVENLQKAQDNVKTLITNLQSDLTTTVEQDLSKVKNRFLKEKRDIETLLNKTVLGEIKKAQTYIDTQKKELQKIQTRLEKYIKQEKSKAKKTIKKKLGKKTTKKAKTAKKKASAN
jgi:hypothetical protein